MRISFAAFFVLPKMDFKWFLIGCTMATADKREAIIFLMQPISYKGSAANKIIFELLLKQFLL